MTDSTSDDFESWLRSNDPPSELAVPAATWDSAVESAFDPTHELSGDLTAAPGPDPLDEEIEESTSSDTELVGFDDDLTDTYDGSDVFGVDDHTDAESFGDTTFDDSSHGDDF